MKRSGTRFSNPRFDLQHVFSRRKAGAVRYAKDVRVDGDGRLAESDVHHDIRGLAADARQAFQRLVIVRHLAAEFREQLLGQRRDVFCFRPIEPDRLDVVADPRLAERRHFRGRVGGFEQRRRRLVHAGVGRLRGKNDRDEQRKGVLMQEFAFRRGIGLLKAAEGFADFLLRSKALRGARCVFPEPVWKASRFFFWP